MSGLCDLAEFPVEQRVAIVRDVLQSFSVLPATAPDLPPTFTPSDDAVAGPFLELQP